MTALLEINDFTLEDCLSVLKPYEKKQVETLLKAENQNIENVVKILVTSIGSKDIITFGGDKDSVSFIESFKNEFNLFLCNKELYIEERKNISNNSNFTLNVLIYSISGAIGGQLGITAGLLVAPVAILLSGVAKIGLNAYCKKILIDEEKENL